MITNIQKKFIQLELEGKIQKGRNPRRYSSYKRRTRARIDREIENLLWTAEYAPEILSDREFEKGDDTIKEHRRARALLKAVSLFENEPTIFVLIAEIFSKHQVELQRKE